MKRKTAAWGGGILGFLTMITGGLLWWHSDSTIKFTITTPPPPPILTFSPPTRPNIPSDIVGNPRIFLPCIWCQTKQDHADWYTKGVEQGERSSKEIHHFIVPPGVGPRRQTSVGTEGYQIWQAGLWEAYQIALAKLEQDG